MCETVNTNPEIIAAMAAKLTKATGDILRDFKIATYAIAGNTLAEILNRYPEIYNSCGAAINVVAPVYFNQRVPLYHISWIQLADGTMVQAICGMSRSTEPTFVFMSLPPLEGSNSHTIPGRSRIGSRDRNDCTEPSLGALFQFLELVAADLPAVLDHIEVRPNKT